MTTQWNPAQAHGEPGARDRAEGEDRESVRPASGARDEERTRSDARPEGGPWRGYTMPVPEHPEHSASGEDPEEPAYDGIAGYPDPSGAIASRTASEGDENAPEGEGAALGRPEASPGAQRRSGRHARHSAGPGRDQEGVRRADTPGAADHEDPEGLAGWVGSLADAVDDTRIAGRNTGAFPVVGQQRDTGEGGPSGQGARARRISGAQARGGASAGAPGPGEEDERTGDRVDSDPGPGQRQDQRAPAPVSGPGTASGASETGGDGTTARGPEEPAPLPRRVPGPSVVSGAFRAVGPDTVAGESGEEEDYRPTTHDGWESDRTITRAELIERLDALATLTELGREDLPQELTARSTQLLDHAGARLRLSGDHTVVALAGGTGSGKSSLFNALCGLQLSQTGVTRPTTSNAHACVWGHEGADALLSWLGVPTRYRHSRTSVLDAGNSELTGLVLLDLPDHDSVRSMHTAEADRLIGSVDLLVWVLDPQKYADAAVHHRYLAQMAGHGAVTVAVLNQVDKVGSDELEELLTDLRRLLEAESGVHPRVITTSTVTGQGIDDLREFLAGTVRERRALVDRLAADLDQVIEPFEEFHGETVPETVPAEVRARIQEGLASAAGVAAVADVTETNDVRRGKRQVGWPVARGAVRLRKDPLAAVQLDFLRRDGENGVGGPVDAPEAELETALGEAADTVSEGMPAPWRRRMRAAARSGVPELPAELGEAVSGAVGDPDLSPSWWRVARASQYALLAVAGGGLAWAVVALLSWFGGGITGLRAFDDPLFAVYSGAVVVAALLVGWLTGVGCGNLVEVAAVQRREDVERTAQNRVREITGLRVVEPMETELARYRAFLAAYEVARAAD
ncbi:YfjP family GTPase [Nocardiopsis quinghaiensis]|uniref:YfjP family GTPase n=1 Tax=Nocardiopsis quinghaiensis TaxID=464995 RepID=UPI00123B2E0F|nr:YfjP family GTPase [Nocardiopsis quinghaiensis]